MVNLFVCWNEIKLDYILHVSNHYFKLSLRFAVTKSHIGGYYINLIINLLCDKRAQL